MSKKVIVFGATGNTGVQICKALESHSIIHSAFVRENSASKIDSKSTEILLGSVLDSTQVSTIFKEQSFTDVVIALGSKDLKSSGIRSKGTKNIVDAIQNSGQQCHLHVISAMGIGESWSQLKWHAKLISKLLIKSTMNDHTEQEKIIKSSTFPYHIIRPVGLKDGAATGNTHVQNEGYLPSNSIQRSDLAEYIVSSLLNDKTGVSGICG